MATMGSFNRNVPYLKQQFSALLQNTSPVITIICLVTTCGYLLSFSEFAFDILSVTPGRILPPSFWIWTAFTFCFIELHIWNVIVDIVTVGLCGKLLEPLWGQLEMIKFFGLTNFGVSIISTSYYLLIFACTRDSNILFHVHIHGLAGYVAGVTVAVRQMMPDHLIIKTKYGKLTNRNIPLTVLMSSILLWAFNILDGEHPVMFCSGLITSWIYLRFYQWHSNGRGDSSDSFTFASFFPQVLQPVISVVVNPIYLFCLKIGVVNQPAPPRSVSSSSLSSIAISMPGIDPHDIERRRQIALKALNERLKTTDSNRSNLVPKSFPVQSGKHGHGNKHFNSHHQGHRSHHHNHNHPPQHKDGTPVDANILEHIQRNIPFVPPPIVIAESSLPVPSTSSNKPKDNVETLININDDNDKS